jgi:hypothetical protein
MRRAHELIGPLSPAQFASVVYFQLASIAVCPIIPYDFQGSGAGADSRATFSWNLSSPTSSAGRLRQICKPMNQRPWINKYGSVAVLLLLLLIMNPELRAFLLLANFIGLDLMVFLIAMQLWYLLPAVASIQHPMRTFLCVASYATLRFATRMIALLLAPADRATAGLTTLLFVLSKNLWCPTRKPVFRPI